MKTANEILFEHGINTMMLHDDFNTQLSHAMERYAEEYAAQFKPPVRDYEKEAKELYPEPETWVDKDWENYALRRARAAYIKGCQSNERI